MPTENPNKVVRLMQNQFHALSTLVDRYNILRRLGKSYSNERDTYEALGYIVQPSYEDYDARFERGDIAGTIIEEPCRATWQDHPDIEEIRETGSKSSVGGETEFEKQWLKLVRDAKIYHYLRRADIISGIGQFGALFLGIGDGKSPDKEVSITRNNPALLYVRPFAQDSLSVKEWERDASNPRYGLPKTYTLKVVNLNNVTPDNAATSSGKAITIHWSRIIHIAEGMKDNDVYGMPRLKRVLNRLEDMDRVVGGSAEMFWRGAFPGYNFKLDPEADPAAQSIDDAKDQIEEYIHKMKRYLRLQGIDVQTIAPQISSPQANFEVLISIISAVTRIPKRKFLGSERGELASGQDDENWNDYIHDRRLNYIEPFVLRVFIDRMISFGILPEPKLGYNVRWHDLNTLSDKDRAEVSRTRTEALVKYTAAVGADLIVPPGVFRRRFLEMEQDDIEASDEEIKYLIEEENRAIAEEEARLQREQNRIDEGDPRSDGNNPPPNQADPNMPAPTEDDINRTAGSRRRRVSPPPTE